MNAPSTHDSEENHQRDEDNVVTLLDVLEEQNELEEDANAVLGGADDKMCTYSKGYMSRQPLYACATCNPPGDGKPAGICLACSYHCHEGHELIELYTKRNFRCDCGNSRFPTTKCNLEPGKEEVNSGNMYNQNFMGTYCTCKRPYPDPEDPVEDEMIQCVICEDWFHRRHLGVDVEAPVEFGEMICGGCMGGHEFLWKYLSQCVRGGEKESGEGEVEGVGEGAGGCRVGGWEGKVGVGARFWAEGWRKKLCTCEGCVATYEGEKVSFLLSETDTVAYYESRNKELAKESQRESQNEEVMRALSSLDRVKQVEVIEGYNQMKAELMDYLQKFAEKRKVVREEDIREFFSQMQARKKHRVEVPYFCH